MIMICFCWSLQKALLEILTAADVIAATTTTASPDGVLKYVPVYSPTVVNATICIEAVHVVAS